MKRLLIIFLLILPIFNISSAQDLNAEWKRIEQLQNNKSYNDLIELLPPFIKVLEKNALFENTIEPYLYLGETYYYFDNIAEGDSAYEKAKDLARQYGKEEILLSIDQNRIVNLQVKLDQSQKITQEQKLIFYDKIIQLADTINRADVKVQTLYKRALLFDNSNDKEAAINDLERANIYAGVVEDKKLRKAVGSKLIQLYQSTGQSEKALALSSEDTFDQRLSAVYSYANELGESGQFLSADNTLRTVQDSVLHYSNPSVIESFAKKRLSFYIDMDRLEDGIDTLSSIISYVRTNTNPTAELIFDLDKIYVLSALQAGRLTEVDSVIRLIETSFSSNVLPEEIFNQFHLLKGDISYLQGSYFDAIDYYSLAMERPEGLSNKEYLALLNNIGLAYLKTGNYDESLKHLGALYNLANKPESIDLMIQADLNTGLVQIKKGEIEEAIEIFKRAKDVSSKKGFDELNIMSRLRLAESYRMLGYQQVSEQTFREIKELQKKLEKPYTRIQLLNALAAYEKNAGSPVSAVAYLEEALKIAKHSGFRSTAISIAYELADVYMIMERNADAIALYKFSLPHYIETHNTNEVIYIDLKLGQCFANSGNNDSAKFYIGSAYSLLTDLPMENYKMASLETVDDIYLFAITLSLQSYLDYVEGMVNDDLRTIKSSYDKIQKSVELLVDNFTTQLSSDRKKEQSWFKNINSFQMLVSIALTLFERTEDQQYLEVAFNANEQLRSQTFVLEVGQQLVSRLSDPTASEIADLSNQIRKTETITEPLSVDLTNKQPNDYSLRGIKITKDTTKNVLKQQIQYDEIINGLKNTDSKVVDLVSINTLKLNSVRDFIQPNEVLLSYSVLNDETILFCVTSESRSVYKIKLGTEQISDMVRSLRESINNHQQSVMNLVLYDSLLAPVQNIIENKSLIIVPSGQLHNLPFSALFNDGKYLIETNVIAQLPNASTLQFINRARDRMTSGNMLAVGNPANDILSPLPGAETEVKAIEQIFPQSFILTKNDATESIVKQQMSNYGIIHFACHGLFNYDYPLLSSLVLSPDDYNDGRLELHEIYNLKLFNTDLVVMSACETALSQIKKNDDMIGLVRGFLYAGVPSIIASLWKVDDNATFELMRNFYLYLNQGLDKGEALRKAQISLIQSQNYTHPFYWAAFTLNGRAE
ncbi:MAG: CHAT domain-containing protein [Melioribacteraceae bacterium]|nr:CHAT domain-containing protein [Melioribacteraceae bacterium]MCF8356153.1 CHAT domain-containing protein [Melioribacteraceae bacterium]MCF8395617.1 CHAT domain-containing protein [Melioribacteraceae bacterium]MCF8420868.1 CHAT domain-containing protein [Melioribacteraceae bacterium]